MTAVGGAIQCRTRVVSGGDGVRFLNPFSEFSLCDIEELLVCEVGVGDVEEVEDAKDDINAFAEDAVGAWLFIGFAGAEGDVDFFGKLSDFGG